MDWLTIAINSLVVCSITSIPLSILIKGLGDYIKKHNVLEKVLKEKIIQLNSAKNEAEKANDLKTKFLANMSHEVRTPLNVIMGFSEIVQNGMYNDKAERNQFLRTISINGHYLLNVIENILDISMIESNQFKYSIHEVGVLSIINELKEVYQLKKQIWR
ncbi:sensor histidine kinase [Carboxylicivirga marina]|uniref:sensor histidine kinase n=1 Tax=Carboxylicivirga marina TaxID=2800988 RepID=UPI0025947822|nr:histidine kinase dimerization/phospho-acceptor domain-containing protein [uncultured Carboxylicivirga sp.]